MGDTLSAAQPSRLEFQLTSSNSSPLLSYKTDAPFLQGQSSQHPLSTSSYSPIWTISHAIPPTWNALQIVDNTWQMTYFSVSSSSNSTVHQVFSHTPRSAWVFCTVCLSHLMRISTGILSNLPGNCLESTVLYDCISRVYTSPGSHEY